MNGIFTENLRPFLNALVPPGVFMNKRLTGAWTVKGTELTWAAFGGRDHEAVIDGDFAMTENELQTVLKVMRSDGINIVAIHQHMMGEEPRILFLHYWAKGGASKLAQAFKHALDAQAEVVKHASVAQ